MSAPLQALLESLINPFHMGLRPITHFRVAAYRGAFLPQLKSYPPKASLNASNQFISLLILINLMQFLCYPAFENVFIQSTTQIKGVQEFPKMLIKNKMLYLEKNEEL